MRIIKTFILILLAGLIVIQFFHPPQNRPYVKATHDISTAYAVPANVRSILAKACNDCHSNDSRYPWYSNIQPIGWWLYNHIREGKRELNFNEFTTYRIVKQYHKLEEVIDLVKKDEMPLASYTLIHSDAKLTEQEKALLIKWAEAIRDTIKVTYPADSLVRKKSRS